MLASPAVPTDAPDATETPSDADRTSKRPPAWQIFMDLVLAAAIVFGGYLGAQELLTSTPRAKRKPVPREATLVEVTTVAKGPQRVTIEASGTVVPARQIALHPQVSGVVETVDRNLDPGGLVDAGTPLVTLDKRDYELAVSTARTRVTQAQAQQRVEKGAHRVAAREAKILGALSEGEGDSSLMLREPQKAAARAEVRAARAAVEQAQLALSRTTVLAPFDAVVLARSVAVGSQIGPATPLATLVDRDRWWVEVQVPVDELRWLQIPDKPGQPGSKAEVRDDAAWEPLTWRDGSIERVAPDLGKEGRLARVLVAVKDPLALLPETAPAARMSLGAWMQVRFAGALLDDVAKLPRRLLREGKAVWLMTADGHLEVRDVTVVFAARDWVLIRDGLDGSERIVTTDLPAPVPGMELRTKDDPPPAKTAEAETEPEPRGRGQ